MDLQKATDKRASLSRLHERGKMNMQAKRRTVLTGHRAAYVTPPKEFRAPFMHDGFLVGGAKILSKWLSCADRYLL